MRDLEEGDVDAAGAVLDTDSLDDADEADEVRRAVGGKRRRQDLLPTARVVGILRRNWRPYCGLLLHSPVPGKWPFQNFLRRVLKRDI